MTRRRTLVAHFALPARTLMGTPYWWLERYFIGNGDWDAVMVMFFPDRKAFIATLNHPDYKSMARHREAGLLCQELLTTRPARAEGVL